jgi:TonB family protein
MKSKLLCFVSLIILVLGGAFVFFSLSYSDPTFYFVEPPKMKPIPNYLQVDLSENSLYMAKILEISFDQSENVDDCCKDHIILLPAPQLINKVTPIYPETALQKKIGGKVVIDLLINEKGMVEDTMILVSTNHIFDESVLEAVKKCRYAPPEDVFGNSVRGWHTVVWKFSP